MENPSPVIAYKVCGRKDEKHLLLKEENFLLVLMTGFQADMFAKFSALSCIDSTHKTNEYGYKLITLLVIDEFRKGQPVAWAITDVEDAQTYQEFFKSVKWRVPEAVIETLMTDDDTAIITACAVVYPEVNHLLCRAWQRKLHSLVTVDAHKAEMYKCLWMLMTEGDTKVFNESFLQYWESRQPRFTAYFKQNYASRVEKWALSYRHFEHKDTDTNMFVESFHNKLKTNPRYLNHNVNRRCDDLVEVLLLLEIDMFYDRKRIELFSSTTEVSYKLDGDRHSRGQFIPDSNVHHMGKGLEHGYSYTVKSVSSDHQYTVHMLASQCSYGNECIPHCTQGKCSYLCRHMISCTCYD
jgi:hypothetical protein